MEAFVTHQAFAIYVPALYVSLSRSLSLPVSLPLSLSRRRSGRPFVRPSVCLSHAHTGLLCRSESHLGPWGIVFHTPRDLQDIFKQKFICVTGISITDVLQAFKIAL